MYFLLAQILFALWAIIFAHFQSPCIKAMREYVPTGNPYTRPFHNRGAAITIINACILCLSMFYYDRDWLECVFVVPAFYGIYRTFFDTLIAIEVYKKKVNEAIFHLGTSAKQDAWFGRHFPHDDPGEMKFIFCLSLVLLFNLINYLL